MVSLVTMSTRFPGMYFLKRPASEAASLSRPGERAWMRCGKEEELQPYDLYTGNA